MFEPSGVLLPVKLQMFGECQITLSNAVIFVSSYEDYWVAIDKRTFQCQSGTDNWNDFWTIQLKECTRL